MRTAGPAPSPWCSPPDDLPSILDSCRKYGLGGGKGCAPYWTTYEPLSIDMKAASVGILDQRVAGLR
jgi:hypothetical protein